MTFSKLTQKKLLDLRKDFTRDYGICDFTFGANYLWFDYFKSTFAITKSGVPIIANCNEESYAYPIGSRDIESALDELAVYVRSQNKSFVIDRVPQECVEMVLKKFGGGTVEQVADNWCDYIYDIDALAEMTGKKYNGLRNHINKFLREYPQATFRLIEQDDIPNILIFLEEYVTGYKKASKSFRHDNKAAKRMLENYDKLGLIGGAAFVGDKVLGFAIAEYADNISKTFFVHIEKCSKEVPSVSKFLVREFAKVGRNMGAKLVNRAEDMGDAGIRYSKQQYNPLRLEYKYRMILNA